MYSHVACDVMKERTLYLLKPSSLIWHLMPYLFLFQKSADDNKTEKHEKVPSIHAFCSFYSKVFSACFKNMCNCLVEYGSAFRVNDPKRNTAYKKAIYIIQFWEAQN